MGFAFNPSLNHIDISQQNIVDIYRSKSELLLPDARFKGHTCEAYICISKIEKTMKAYVALLEMGMKSVFIFTSDYSTENIAEYPKVLADAEGFLQSMGFSMERVNLDFSPAMREVIIKGFRVMRPPAKKPVLRSHASHQAASVSAISKQLALEKTAFSITRPDSLQTELKSLQTKLSSAKTVVEKITREKIALEQSASREIALLRSAAEKAAELKRSSEDRLAKEIKALKEEKLTTDSGQHDDMVTTLKAELALATRTAEAARETYSSELSSLNKKIELIVNEKARLENLLATEKNSSAETISKLAAENNSLNSLLTSEKIAATDKIASLTLFEASWRESQLREEELYHNVVIMKEQIDLLEADLEKHRLKENREAALQLKIASLEKEAEKSRAEIEQLVGRTPDTHALEVEVNILKAAKDDVEAEYIRLANEVMEKEAAMLETLYEADAEILRLSRDLELQQRVAKTEGEALRDELKLLLISGSAPTLKAEAATKIEISTSTPPIVNSDQLDILPIEPEPTPEPPVADKSTATLSPPPVKSILDKTSPEDADTDEPVAGDPEITKGLINEFGSFCISNSHSATEFKIDPDTNMIEYSDPAEVLAILYSSNTVQAVPDGSSMQRCKGYIIALKKAGEYRAYLAWYMTESGKVVICNPEQQPADSVECTQIIKDAISYFEIVGFMMELEDLGSTRKSYNSAIRKVPALSKK